VAPHMKRPAAAVEDPCNHIMLMQRHPSNVPHCRRKFLVPCKTRHELAMAMRFIECLLSH
jgi:hypothetical protein